MAVEIGERPITRIFFLVRTAKRFKEADMTVCQTWSLGKLDSECVKSYLSNTADDIVFIYKKPIGVRNALENNETAGSSLQNAGILDCSPGAKPDIA